MRVDLPKSLARKNSASIRERFSGQRPQEERVSTDHTDPGPLEGLIPPEMLLTMNGGEPTHEAVRGAGRPLRSLRRCWSATSTRRLPLRGVRRRGGCVRRR